MSESADALAPWPLALAVGATIPSIPVTVAARSLLRARLADLAAPLPVATVGAALALTS